MIVFVINNILEKNEPWLECEDKKNKWYKNNHSNIATW